MNFSGMGKRFLEETPGFYENSCRNVPLGRWAEPEEVAPLMLFLASPASDYITGADFNIDGGYTLW